MNGSSNSNSESSKTDERFNWQNQRTFKGSWNRKNKPNHEGEILLQAQKIFKVRLNHIGVVIKLVGQTVKPKVNVFKPHLEHFSVVYLFPHHNMSP